MPARSGAQAVSVVSPNGVDAELAVRFLAEQGVEARACGSLAELAAQLDDSTGCVVAVEEALLEHEIPLLRDALSRLPAWADLPLVFVARDVAQLGLLCAGAFPASGNVTLLERPLNPHTLVSAVQVALRAAARQREVGELIAQRGEAVRLRDEFLAMLAHELRNPLAPMRNALYVMRSQPLDNPLLRQSAGILERQVGHIVRMVDDLMDVARLERGKVTLRRQRVDLNRVVAAAVESSAHAAQAAGHRLHLELAAEPLPLDADPVRLEQIVSNLVNNAAKFTPEPGEIRVQTLAAPGEGVVVVQDRGVGFESGAAEALFAPFMQVNPTIERSAGGLGIGLTIVRRLAELHGGSVSAASEGPGRGARFAVRLPLASGAPKAEPAGRRREAPARTRRVVVIEDNADIRDSLRTLLVMWGHQVVTAPDGRSGLDTVLSACPDVALVDIGLPGLSGYDVARGIRARLPERPIRLIAITGYGQPADRERAFEAGFDVHLLKPIDPEILEREMQR